MFKMPTNYIKLLKAAKKSMDFYCSGVGLVTLKNARHDAGNVVNNGSHDAGNVVNNARYGAGNVVNNASHDAGEVVNNVLTS
jgi:hypothetical protein